MQEQKMKVDRKKVDTKEFEIPETIFIRDIENRVFQGIILQCLSTIDGIALIEGNFIDNILGLAGSESIKGIIAEQDSKKHSVDIKIELNIRYGISIPEKADEIQMKVAEVVTNLTGLHVSSVHIVFKNVLSSEQMKKIAAPASASSTPSIKKLIEGDYNDEF